MNHRGAEHHLSPNQSPGPDVPAPSPTTPLNHHTELHRPTAATQVKQITQSVIQFVIIKLALMWSTLPSNSSFHFCRCTCFSYTTYDFQLHVGVVQFSTETRFERAVSAPRVSVRSEACRSSLRQSPRSSSVVQQEESLTGVIFVHSYRIILKFLIPRNISSRIQRAAESMFGLWTRTSVVGFYFRCEVPCSVIWFSLKKWSVL